MVFKPCLHIVACDSCSSIMKKCVKCRTTIETAIPLSVASGGRRELSCVGHVTLLGGRVTLVGSHVTLVGSHVTLVSRIL